MKRLLLLFFALFLTAILPHVLRAQDNLPDLLDDENTIEADSSDGPQRIGIPAARFELPPNETGTISGYCFDEHLIAPTRTTTFHHVLAGNDDAVVRTADGRTRNLRDALRTGDVNIKAMGLSVTFVNRTSQPMSVSLATPTVLWDRPAGRVNPLALRALNTNTDYDSRQNAVWRVTNTERRLHALGYLKGSIYAYDRDRLAAATNAFQKDNGLAATNELDATTIERVKSVEGDLRDRLRALGFQSREGRFARENLGSQVRTYQKFLGSAATGRWSPELDASLASTEELVPQLNRIRPSKGQQIADQLTSDDASNVITYVTSKRSLMMLANAPAGIELWSRTGGVYSFGGRGIEAIRRIDEASVELAQRASRDSRRAVIYAAVSDEGLTSVAIGANVVDVPTKELAAFANGGSIPARLKATLATLVPQSLSSRWTGASEAATFVIYRGALQQGRATDALRKLGLEQIDATKLARALDRVYGERVALYVSDDLRNGAQRYDGSMGAMRTRVRETGLATAE